MYVLLINVFFYFESSSFSNIYYTDYARNANYEVEKYLKMTNLESLMIFQAKKVAF